MISVTKHIKISILTIAVFVPGVIFRYPPVFYITYAVMILHELAHTLAAVCIGLKIDCIVFQPFGVNLRLKNKMVYSLADEIILYISGPLVNGAAAVCSALLYRRFGNEAFRLFYITNIMLFAMNLLPAVPLDGGIILKRAFASRFGAKRAARVTTFVSGIVCAALFALGVYTVLGDSHNFSVLVFALLILGNIFTQSEKYESDFVRELMFSDKKKKTRLRFIGAEKDADLRELAAMFSRTGYCIVYFFDENGSVFDVRTETEILEELMKIQPL